MKWVEKRDLAAVHHEGMYRKVIIKMQQASLLEWIGALTTRLGEALKKSCPTRGCSYR